MTYMTFRGDVAETVIGQIMGPDIHGGLSEAVEAEHFPLANITRVRFEPISAGDPDRLVIRDEFGVLRLADDV